MSQFRRTTERMGAAGITQFQTARLRAAGMLPNPRKKGGYYPPITKKEIKEYMYGGYRPSSSGRWEMEKKGDDMVIYLDSLKDAHTGRWIHPRFFNDYNVEEIKPRNFYSVGYLITRKNPRKKSNPRLKAVPKHLEETDRGPPYVFPKRKSYPINDLFHARLALIYVMSPTNAPKRDKVINAVADRYPQYNWAAWWNQELKDPKHCRRENIKACPFLETWSHYRNGGGRGSWEQDDPATKHRNPGKAMKRRKNSRLSDEARELSLYTANDGPLYAQRGKYIITTLAKKMANGTFDKKRAVVAFKPLADAGAKKYSVEHGTPQRGVTLRNWGRYKGFGIFTPEVRRETAKELLDGYMDQIEWEAREIKSKKKAKKKSSSRRNPMARRKKLSPFAKAGALIKEIAPRTNLSNYPTLASRKARLKTLRSQGRSAKRFEGVRRNPVKRKNAKTAMTKAEYKRFNAWRGWDGWELDAKYRKYKKELKRGTQVRRKTRGKKRRNPRMNRSEYMERLDNLHPHMSNPRKNSLWKKYSR